MREILFRGKRVDNGKWITGYYFHYETCHEHFIITDMSYDMPDMEQVIPETVGEYTGLTDKNGKKIFEGDIVESTNGMFDIDTTIRKVVFFKGAWGLSDFNEEHFRAFVSMSEYVKSHKIIGNIHDTNL